MCLCVHVCGTVSPVVGVAMRHIGQVLNSCPLNWRLIYAIITLLHVTRLPAGVVFHEPH